MFAKQLIINDVDPCHLKICGTSNQILAQRQAWQGLAKLMTSELPHLSGYLVCQDSPAKKQTEMSKDPAEPLNTTQELSGSSQDSASTSVSDIPTKNSTFKEDENISPHSKPCSLCSRRRDVLIRCQIDDTRKWNFICTGRCWNEVSGGKVDGDGNNPFYRYGGMWKNKHEAVSAKIKGKAKERNRKYQGKFKSENGEGDSAGSQVG